MNHIINIIFWTLVSFLTASHISIRFDAIPYMVFALVNAAAIWIAFSEYKDLLSQSLSQETKIEYYVRVMMPYLILFLVFSFAGIVTAILLYYIQIPTKYYRSAFAIIHGCLTTFVYYKFA